MPQSLSEKIVLDLRQALKEKNQPVVSTIRMFLAAWKNQEIEKRAKLTEPEVIRLLQREIRKIKESISAFQQGQRQDLVAQETAGLKILTGYLPEQLPATEIKEIVQKIIDELQAKAGDFGQVMSVAMKQLQGRAEGQEVNKIVRELLAK